MAYPQRTDLNSPAEVIARQAAKGQTYGEAGRQLEAQKAVPMGAAPSDVSASRQVRQAPTPGSLGDLAGPTTRPNEPVTTGPASTSTMLPMNDPVLEELKVLNYLYPNDDLANLISALEYEGL